MHPKAHINDYGHIGVTFNCDVQHVSSDYDDVMKIVTGLTYTTTAAFDEPQYIRIFLFTTVQQGQSSSFIDE